MLILFCKSDSCQWNTKNAKLALTAVRVSLAPVLDALDPVCNALVSVSVP